MYQNIKCFSATPELVQGVGRLTVKVITKKLLLLFDSLTSLENPFGLHAFVAIALKEKNKSLL